MKTDLNTVETSEYQGWLALMKELRLIHEALKTQPNAEGLKLARTHAYNILADLHDMIEIAEGNQRQAHDESPDPLEDFSSTMKSLN